MMNALAPALVLAGLSVVACSTASNGGVGPMSVGGAGGSSTTVAAGGTASGATGGGAHANGGAGAASGGAGAGTVSGGSGTLSDLDASAPPDSGGGASGSGGGPALLTGPQYYFGVTVDPGACLDVTGAGMSDGSLLEEWACNASGAQAFTAVDAGGGKVHLVNTASKKCVAPGSGGKVALAECDNTPAQTYSFADSGKNGLVSIVNVSSGKCLDVPGANVAAGTQLQFYDCNQSNAQLWTRTRVDHGFTGACGIGQLQAGSVLAAMCKNDASQVVSSTLHLDRCLSNSNGALAWATPGGFAESCSACTLKDGVTLTCQCKNVSAQSAATSIDLSATINDCNGVLTCGACGSGAPVDSGATAFTALYGSDGNDFYQFTGASSIANLKPSGWNALFMFGITVHSNGDIVHGGTLLVHDGTYVGDANWGPSVAALKTPPTTVTRYEVTLGGWGDPSYDAIQSLVGAQGTGSGSVLYRNFQALKSAVPGIDAINDDDEQTYDIGSSTAFGQMLNGLGLKLTQAPYMNQGFWVQLKHSLGAGCDIVYLQVYQGGLGNDPAQWNGAYGGGFHVVPGQESNYHASSWFAGWKASAQITGGFYWPDVTWAPDANWGIAEIADGVGLPAL